MTRGGKRWTRVLSAGWKIGVPLLAGLIALGSARAGGLAGRPALLLAGAVTGVLLLTAFLLGIEFRLNELDEHVTADLGQIDRFTELSAQMQRSVLGIALLTQFLAAAGEAESSSSPLLLSIARREVERLTGFMRHLPVAGEIAYDGEDREWLLALAKEAAVSIDGISLSTVDAGMHGFDGGLWTSDLGARYLEAQHDAIGRGVVIRRIFVFETEDLSRDETFQNITQTQRNLGIRVRMLDHQIIPEWLRPMISDFIVFDRSLGYETAVGTVFGGGLRSTRPAMVRTSLTTEPDRVQRLQKQFEELWDAADPQREIAG
jgi:hypothetical protein